MEVSNPRLLFWRQPSSRWTNGVWYYSTKGHPWVCE